MGHRYPWDVIYRPSIPGSHAEDDHLPAAPAPLPLPLAWSPAPGRPKPTARRSPAETVSQTAPARRRRRPHPGDTRHPQPDNFNRIGCPPCQQPAAGGNRSGHNRKTRQAQPDQASDNGTHSDHRGQTKLPASHLHSCLTPDGRAGCRSCRLAWGPQRVAGLATGDGDDWWMGSRWRVTRRPGNTWSLIARSAIWVSW